MKHWNSSNIPNSFEFFATISFFNIIGLETGIVFRYIYLSKRIVSESFMYPPILGWYLLNVIPDAFLILSQSSKIVNLPEFNSWTVFLFVLLFFFALLFVFVSQDSWLLRQLWTQLRCSRTGLIFGLSLATAPWTLDMILVTRESRSIIITVITGHESDVWLVIMMTMSLCVSLRVL